VAVSFHDKLVQGSKLFRTTFALAFCGAGRRNFARLHELANISGGTGQPLTSCMSKSGNTYDWRNALPPSSFSCSALTESTRSHIVSKLAWSCFACLLSVSMFRTM
jgi:hypothetical protein